MSRVRVILGDTDNTPYGGGTWASRGAGIGGEAAVLFENRGGLRFEEVGLASGVALDGRGNPLAGMGVASGDVDGDGLADLLVSNFLGRSTVGFKALGGGIFADASDAFGLAAATRPVLGFGVSLADFDSDGLVDFATVPYKVPSYFEASDPAVMVYYNRTPQHRKGMALTSAPASK